MTISQSAHGRPSLRSSLLPVVIGMTGFAALGGILLLLARYWDQVMHYLAFGGHFWGAVGSAWLFAVVGMAFVHHNARCYPRAAERPWWVGLASLGFTCLTALPFWAMATYADPLTVDRGIALLLTLAVMYVHLLYQRAIVGEGDE